MTSALVPTKKGEAGDEPPQLFVVFRVGDAEYALPAAQVLQMETYSGATPVPGSRDFVAGIIQLRGRVVPVVDLRARFGLPRAETTFESRVVVGESDGRVVALLADTAREVVRIGSGQQKNPPRLVDEGGFVRHRPAREAHAPRPRFRQGHR